MSYRYTDDKSWRRLACCMTLLVESDLSRANTVLLAEQLLYLAHGKEVLTEQVLEDHDSLTGSSIIPKSLWEELYKIPLSADYYTSVISSLETHPQFWEGYGDDTSGEGQKRVKDFSEYPWKDQSHHAAGLGLDDYVMLKCLDEERFWKKISGLIDLLVDSVSVPLLSEVLLTNSTQPVLLLYEEACPRSQALIYSLEETIRNTFKVL